MSWRRISYMAVRRPAAAGILVTALCLFVLMLVGCSGGSGGDDGGNGGNGGGGGHQITVRFLIDEYLDASFLSRLAADVAAAFEKQVLARVHHETNGFYAIPFTETAYDVDQSLEIDTAGLSARLDPADLTTWPNVIDLRQLADDNDVLLASILAALAPYDPIDLIGQRIRPALDNGHRVILARDFITHMIYGDQVCSEVPYFLFIDLDSSQPGAVLELQGFNQAQPFPDAPVIHDPHVEKLLQLLTQGTGQDGALWALCLRGNTRIQKLQAVVVSHNGGVFTVDDMTATCQDCCSGYKFQFNPPLYPVKKPKEPIPIREFEDLFNPGRNPGIPLNQALGHPHPAVQQGEPPDLVDFNPVIPIEPDGTTPPPGDESASEADAGGTPSGDACCDNWDANTPSIQEVDCWAAYFQKSKASFEYWKRSQHGMANMDPVVQQTLDAQAFVNSQYALNQAIFYQEVWFGLAFDPDYGTMVTSELDRIVNACGGCSSIGDSLAIEVDGAAQSATSFSLDCTVDCDAGCLPVNPFEDPAYLARKACLQNELDAVQNAIAALQGTIDSLLANNPNLELWFVRTTIWDNIFFQGVGGINAQAFCPSMGGPGVQDFGVDAFFHNVYLGIVTNNQGVDEAIDNAITQEMKADPAAAGLVQCALGQLKQSLKNAYENELQQRGYDPAQVDLLMNKALTPDEAQALAQIQDSRRRRQLESLLFNKLQFALTGLERAQAECARRYMENRVCQLSAIQALMEGFRQSLQPPGALDFNVEFRHSIPHCDICREIQRLACCQGGNPICAQVCAGEHPAQCCNAFDFPCGFMKYLICFGNQALAAGEPGEPDKPFCPDFAFNALSCESICHIPETCDEDCLDGMIGGPR